jgi:hypothetical protein
MATKKVTVNLPEEQIEFLQEIAKRENLTFTEVLRRSIKSEKFFTEQEDKGRKILIEEKGQRLREVVRS